ncbi:MAG: methyltransferase domain-containing protein [Campylobacterota bacterium]|nr:methyltransferase domain-containing protein [Campylobacterota bacterium]
MRIDLKDKNAQEILHWFENNPIQHTDDTTLEIEILQSDIERIGYKAWIDFAQLHNLKMLTPHTQDNNILLLRFQKLNTKQSFHQSGDKSSEKYGIDSEFFTIDKTMQFTFIYHYEKALNFINITDKKRVLNLGVNKGDEFHVIQNMLAQDKIQEKEFVGIDYSQSAISYAQNNFTDANFNFICHDINKLSELNLGKFDLIISIGTLQSSNLNFKEVFMNMYQNHLEKDGAIILGFPNCRWIDGEMIYGAKAPNYNFPEMSLVIKDIYFCKKYLQQKRYRVTLTGKDYIFLTARKIL